MLLEKEKDYLIALKSEYKKAVIDYKKKNPHLKIKTIFKRELISMLSFSYDKNTIKEMMILGYDYNSAKYYLDVLCKSDFTENKKLYEIYNLIKDHLIFDSYGLYELKNKDIVLFEEEKDDIEIKRLLNINNLSFSHLTLDDLNIEKKESILAENNCLFKTKFDQYLFIFSDIKKRIKENEEIKDKLTILIDNEDDMYYIEIFSSLFNIPVFLKKNLSLLSKTSLKDNFTIKKDLSNILDKKDFHLDKIDPSLKALIDDYQLDKIDFDLAYTSLLEIINENCLSVSNGDRGIAVTDSFSFNSDCYYYVTNFCFNSFYKNYQDNELLSDEQKELITSLTSYQKTKLDRTFKLNFLLYNNIILLSRVEQHQSDNIFDSQFISEFKLNDFFKKYVPDDDMVVTSKAEKIIKNDEYSLLINPKSPEELQLGKFDPSFKGINNYPKAKDKYSVTNLEDYVTCPYRYYLKSLLPLSTKLNVSATDGTFIHKVFETINHRNYNYKKIFNEILDEKKDSLSMKEKTFFEVLYYHLEDIVSIYRTWFEDDKCQLIETDNDHEINISFELKDNNKTYPFTGKIDSVVYTQGKEATYWTIVDYKTGSEKYSVIGTIIGKSIQLPLYSYSLKDHINDKVFAGFGIRSIYFKSPKDAYCDKDKMICSSQQALKNMKLNGVILDEEDYYSSFDKTSISKKGTLIARGGNYLAHSVKNSQQTFNYISYSGDENLLNKKDADSYTYNLNDLIDDSKKVAVSIIDSISKNNFDIRPIPSNYKNTTTSICSIISCPYKDICYKDKRLKSLNTVLILKKRIEELKKRRMNLDE